MFVLLIDYSHYNTIINFGELHFELALLTAQHTTAKHNRITILFNTLLGECDGVVGECQPVVVLALVVDPLLSCDSGLLTMLKLFGIFDFVCTYYFLYFLFCFFIWFHNFRLLD